MGRTSSRKRTPLQRWIDRTPGMSQLRLAQIAGVDQSLMSKYARGERRPGPRNANAIEEATDGAIPAVSWRPEEPPEVPC
jgi:transcriptional regulator with XRE-family HTH domain